MSGTPWPRWRSGRRSTRAEGGSPRNFGRMSQTITIRLTKELSAWLEQRSKRSGVPRGRIIRELLEKARDGEAEPSFMSLAGTIRGARNLSARKDFHDRESISQPGHSNLGRCLPGAGCSNG